ncbi:hypothetical protein [Desulfoscipio sp. XC116]|uniref:hypothetical protein n=1 Tax=Desulfoscipio sp. XC116 TaxID=3144975 RepID=UPI00325AFD3A
MIRIEQWIREEGREEGVRKGAYFNDGGGSIRHEVQHVVLNICTGADFVIAAAGRTGYSVYQL